MEPVPTPQSDQVYAQSAKDYDTNPAVVRHSTRKLCEYRACKKPGDIDRDISDLDWIPGELHGALVSLRPVIGG